LELSEAVDAGLIEALNKTDRLLPEAHDRVITAVERDPRQAAVSAKTGEGVERLLELIELRLSAGRQEIEISVSLADGATLAWLYRNGEIISRKDNESEACLVVRLDPTAMARFASRGGS
jgi:GTP-binding protein HflX